MTHLILRTPTLMELFAADEENVHTNTTPSVLETDEQFEEEEEEEEHPIRRNVKRRLVFEPEDDQEDESLDLLPYGSKRAKALVRAVATGSE
jgi:hypothetical protein